AGRLVHEVLLCRGQRPRHLVVVAGAGEDGPPLRDGVDAALGVLGRAEGGAVVVVGAPEPVAVPAAVVEAGAEPLAVGAVALGAVRLAPCLAERDPVGEDA